MGPPDSAGRSFGPASCLITANLAHYAERIASSIRGMASYIGGIATYINEMATYIDEMPAYIDEMMTYTNEMAIYIGKRGSYTRDVTCSSRGTASYTSEMTPFRDGMAYDLRGLLDFRLVKGFSTPSTGYPIPQSLPKKRIPPKDKG